MSTLDALARIDRRVRLFETSLIIESSKLLWAAIAWPNFTPPSAGLSLPDEHSALGQPEYGKLKGVLLESCSHHPAMSISTVRLACEASACACRLGPVPRDPGICAIADRVVLFVDGAIDLMDRTSFPRDLAAHRARSRDIGRALGARSAWEVEESASCGSPADLRGQDFLVKKPSCAPRAKWRRSAIARLGTGCARCANAAGLDAAVGWTLDAGHPKSDAGFTLQRGWWTRCHTAGVQQGHDKVVGHVISLAEIGHQSSLRAGLGTSVRHALWDECGGWTVELTEGEAQDGGASCLKRERTRASPGRGPLASGRWPSRLTRANRGWMPELVKVAVGHITSRAGQGRTLEPFEGEAQDGRVTRLKGGCARQALGEDPALTVVGHVISRVGGGWTLELTEGESQSAGAACLKGKLFCAYRRKTDIEPWGEEVRCASATQSERELTRARIRSRHRNAGWSITERHSWMADAPVGALTTIPAIEEMYCAASALPDHEKCLVVARITASSVSFSSLRPSKGVDIILLFLLAEAAPL
ncbi:hypothetical protein EVG20_g11350 [Dentipellis fragilis]|uniref:Uncharacterized protein n=1 Tax=Dentipellis fragilis TaxID=205917 RepID=A0A4Y9XLZ3_9AGAM|nr:hypothetical protein EVG20_g11350 [Dentipellis fragilis]